MKHLILLLVLTSSTLSSQILNVESLRKVTDTSGWSGAASVNFSLKRNVNEFLVLGGNVHVQYKMGRHLTLFKGDVAFQKIESENFDNSMVSHLRHNYKVWERVVWETFVQGQYNKISLINFRGLFGLGPRFKLSASDNYRFYLGTLAMYEYEEVADGVTPLQENIRGSAYLSFSLYPKESISIVSTTYYQPKLDGIHDYRISSDTSVLVGLFSNFALNISYTFVYDAYPAVGIQKSQYNFSTGLTYTFD